MIIPNGLYRKHLKKRKAQVKLKEERHNKLVILPFMPGITARMKRFLKKYQIKVATVPLRTMDNVQPSLKDKINKFDQRGFVYESPCFDCIGINDDKLVAHLNHDA